MRIFFGVSNKLLSDKMSAQQANHFCSQTGQSQTRAITNIIIFKVAGVMDKVTGKTFALVVNALFVYQYTCSVF